MSNDANPAEGSFCLFIKQIPAQVKIVVAGVVCLVVLACYVPWTYTFDAGNSENRLHVERAGGYALLSDPPKLPGDFWKAGGVKVDVPRVLIPMAVVVFATVAGVCLVGQKSRKQG
jgi:hypothetical protein